MKKFAPLLIIFASFLWGLDGILRRSLYVLPPIIIVFYEHFIESILIAPLTIKRLKKETITKAVWRVLFIVSFFSSLLGTLFFTAALAKTHHISFSVVYLLQKLQPLFAIVTATIFLKEKINKRYLIWAGLALISAYFVTFPNGAVNFDTGKQTIIAALFSVGAALCWGASTTASRFGLLRHSSTLMTGMRFILAAPMALILVFVLGQQSFLTGLTLSQFGRLTVIALSTGMVAQWIYYIGLKNTQVKISTILELTLPLTAIFIDVFLYKTVLAPTQYLSAAILLFAIYRVSLLNKSTNQ